MTTLAQAEALHEAGRPDEALAAVQAVLRLRPDSAAAHNLAGMVRFEMNALDPAIAHFRRAVALMPSAAGGWANLGAMLAVRADFPAAIAAYDQALARGGDATIRRNRALALLRAGRLREGWPGYAGAPEMPEDLTGRTVLVTHEEGFGDTLQFARYLPLLAARGARVLAWVPRELVALIGSMARVAEVLTGSMDAPPHDFRCSFIGLPGLFSTILETIPASVPYLHADPARVAALALPPGAPRLGLVWAGQARPGLERRRNIPPGCLAALAGLRFVSLQAASAAVPPLALHDPMGAVRDFADTAAIIAQLDLVVSVDTAVAHLAGAMGKKVFLLDRLDCCWRWLSGRTDSPWYPTMRIFRQQRMGDWSGPIRAVADALAGAGALAE